MFWLELLPLLTVDSRVTAVPDLFRLLAVRLSVPVFILLLLTSDFAEVIAVLRVRLVVLSASLPAVASRTFVRVRSLVPAVLSDLRSTLFTPYVEYPERELR